MCEYNSAPIGSRSTSYRLKLALLIYCQTAAGDRFRRPKEPSSCLNSWLYSITCPTCTEQFVLNCFIFYVPKASSHLYTSPLSCSILKLWPGSCSAARSAGDGRVLKSVRLLATNHVLHVADAISIFSQDRAVIVIQEHIVLSKTHFSLSITFFPT